MPRILTFLVLLLAFGVSTRAADAPPLTDLRADLADMRQRGLPMILLFHTHGCGYCHYVIEDHLRPMVLSGAYARRALIRQLDIDSGELTDADGRAADARDLARRYRVRFFPTLLLLGPDGRMLAEPLVGVANIDLYGSQLESALQKAEARLH
ncbi:MAG: thioredoxin family protein [Pseudomonadota bacterium]